MKATNFTRKDFQYLFKAFSFYGPGIATVLLSYFMLINLTQGQDVIMQAGEYVGPTLFTVGCVIIWGFFIWYSSRMVGYEKKNADPDFPIPILSNSPRLLAYNAFVSVQAAILALPTMLDWNGWFVLAFIVAHNLYYFLLHKTFEKKSNKSVRISSYIIALIYIAFLVFMWYKHLGRSAHEMRLPLFSILLFVFQIFSLWFFIYRRSTIDRNTTPPPAGTPENSHLRFLNVKIVRVPTWMLASEQITFTIFNIFAVVGIFVFSLAFVMISFADAMGPLAVVLLAFGVLVGAANMLTLGSLRTGFNWFFILLVLAFLFGKACDPYKVQLTKASVPNIYQNRSDLNTYFGKWFNNRIEAIRASENYRVYLVLADGGASRSGYWVASVLSAWQDESIKKNPNDPFSDHLLCLSGASGGGVGNAAFYSLLKYNSPQDTTYRQRVQNFLKNDFLTFTLSHYLGPDILRHVVPFFPVPDRATALEDVMAYWSNPVFDGFKKNFSEVLDSTGRLPIIFFNTTRVQEGTPSVISSIKLDKFSERVDVLSIVDSTGINGKSYGDLSLSTAAVMGARFPYVSPAGRILDHNFVDGGYFDNSGAGVVHELLQGIQEIMQNEPDSTRKALMKKLCFTVVHISNTPLPSDIEPIHPLSNDLAAPLLTVFSTYNSQTLVNDKRLERFVTEIGTCSPALVVVNLYRNGEDPVDNCRERTDEKETYPMNWVISDYRLVNMNKRLEEVKACELKKLY